MKIITIGREFGSGGRELGRKLAELLHFAYYDQEIVRGIAERTSFAEKYVQSILERRPNLLLPPLSAGHSFLLADPMQKQNYAIYREQSGIIREMAEKSDCVIVGRCADYILRELNPFRIFVYSSEASRLKRCMARTPESEKITEKEMKREIERVNKNRASYYRFFTGQVWGDKINYDLCINLTEIPVAEAAQSIAALFRTIPCCK